MVVGDEVSSFKKGQSALIPGPIKVMTLPQRMTLYTFRIKSDYCSML